MTQVEIDRLGAAGDGIADGAYYPFTLPGELVSPGPPMKVLRAAPDRVQPVCRHFGSCGGCSVQHASDAFLETWKQDMVRRALAAHGLTADLRPVQTSPPHSRRRAVLTLRRTKKTVQMGFHSRGSDQLVDLAECHVMRPGILALRPQLERLARDGASRKGALHVSITESLTGWDVAVTGGKAPDRALRTAIAQAGRGFARLAWNGEVIVQRDPPVQVIGRAHVVPPPGSFLQATADGAQALTRTVRQALGQAAHVADLFCGIGTFTLPLAEQATVHGVEAETGMIQALDAAWRRTSGLKTVTTEVRDLFRRPLIAAELDRFDAVVLDPPRAGALAQVTALAQGRVPVIAMVSCNPVTFARDASVLVAAGYALNWVQIVDQFRWTGHVELVARFGAKTVR